MVEIKCSIFNYRFIFIFELFYECFKFFVVYNEDTGMVINLRVVCESFQGIFFVDGFIIF